MFFLHTTPGAHTAAVQCSPDDGLMDVNISQLEVYRSYPGFLCNMRVITRMEACSRSGLTRSSRLVRVLVVSSDSGLVIVQTLWRWVL